MARTVGKLLCTVWSDPDWRALSKDAQRLYMLILGQGRLSLAGCLDLMPARWAGLATDETIDDLNRALLELEDRGYIALDWDTGELVVRTFAKHDVVGGGGLNRNTIKGFWSAWQGIISLKLRQLVLDNAPDELWTTVPHLVPEGAEQTRRSQRLEPASEPPTGHPSEPATEPPSEPVNEPPRPRPSPSPSPRPPVTDPSVTPPSGALTEDDDDDRARQAEADRRTRLEVDRRRGTPTEVVSATALRNTILANLRTEHWTPPTTEPTRSDSLSSAIPDAATVIAEHAVPPDQITDPTPGLDAARKALKTNP